MIQTTIWLSCACLHAYVLVLIKVVIFLSLSLSVATLCSATVIYFLEGAIAVLAAELPWRSASVFHKVSVKVEGALHNRSAPSHRRLT